MALSDVQQAILMFAAFALGPLAAWFAVGAPFDHSALAVLGGGFVSAILAFIKEYSGSPAPAEQAQAPKVIGYLKDGSPVFDHLD